MSEPEYNEGVRLRPREFPTVVALHYKGDNRESCSRFLGDRYGFEAPYVLIRGDHDDRRVPVGSWIVRDAQDMFFPATDEQLHEWYWPVDELRAALEEIASIADDHPEGDAWRSVRDIAQTALYGTENSQPSSEQA